MTKYRRAGARGNDHLADVIQSAQHTHRSHQQGLVLPVDAVAASVAIARFERLLDVIEPEAVAREPFGLHRDLEGARLAAQRVHVGDPVNGAQARADRPVLERAPFDVAQSPALDAIHVDLAERRRDRRQHRLDAGRQARTHLIQALGHLLPGPINIRAVLEPDGHEPECVLVERAQRRLAWQALHLDLDREGDAALDFGRGHARRLHDHLHLRRVDVGKGIDRKRAKRPQAADDHGHGDEQHHQALHQREANQCSDHGLFSTRTEWPAASRSSAAVSHCSPSSAA